jgi:hypothetical protein
LLDHGRPGLVRARSWQRDDLGGIGKTGAETDEQSQVVAMCLPLLAESVQRQWDGSG